MSMMEPNRQATPAPRQSTPDHPKRVAGIALFTANFIMLLDDTVCWIRIESTPANTLHVSTKKYLGTFHKRSCTYLYYRAMEMDSVSPQ